MDKYSNLVDLVRYFAKTYRYSVLDRMALAMSPESVEAALYDMLRLLNSLLARSIRVKLQVVKDKEVIREYSSITCCEYGRNLGYGIKGIVTEVHEPKERETEYKNETIYCVPCPLIPNESEIKEFLCDVEKDPSIARRIVLMSYGFKG